MLQLEGSAGSGRQWSLCSTDNATGTSVDGGPSGSFAIYDDTDSQARLRIDSNGNARFLVSGGSFTAEGTGAYGMSIDNHNSPSMGHLFIFGDNGLIRFRNSSSVYTAQMGYTESNNAMFFTNQEGGTTMYILSEGVKINDNEKFLCGNDNDLEIYSTGGESHIKNINSHGLIFSTNNSERWGIESGGHLKPHANNAYDLGTSSYGIRNIYVNDLQLSNKAKKDTGGNDVDGTWGDWTLQEGEDKVYMINNRSGKKYSLKMEEE